MLAMQGSEPGARGGDKGALAEKPDGGQRG